MGLACFPHSFQCLATLTWWNCSANKTCSLCRCSVEEAISSLKPLAYNGMHDAKDKARYSQLAKLLAQVHPHPFLFSPAAFDEESAELTSVQIWLSIILPPPFHPTMPHSHRNCPPSPLCPLGTVSADGRLP